MDPSSSDPDFDAITDWAMSLLTMRVNTPSGEWLPEDFERVYRQGWAELEGSFGASTASEMAILDLANIAMHLVDYLVAVTGEPASRWLEQVRRDYVDLDEDS
ncbi:hypothetical protein [Nocardioides marmotae]|uniref:hypothetical protein n=1 Tax=Nocardioides marmotae TaxID=2663857 RepID=UPI0012B5B359|nr:hypothetical protein [Nocardioides marmotae]MBC9735392.1 hypothetical protein [Nocardioides marmotae]MTB86490.1 hypothetical protein [Nocardioides marmotae]QKE02102.1 hypothetical protein HPC71_14230 [Nocardioides marmotae]